MTFSLSPGGGILSRMAKKAGATTGGKRGAKGYDRAAALPPKPPRMPAGRASALLDTRVVYCGDNLEQLAKLPDHCVDLNYIDPPFNSNRDDEVF